MTDLERSIAAYANFLEERSLDRPPDHDFSFDSSKGDLIVVDIQSLDSGEPDAPEIRPVKRGRWLIAVAATLVVAVGTLVVVFADLGEDPAVDTSQSAADGADPSTLPAPEALVVDYINRYNAGDIDALMDLFVEESVITGHPFSARSEGLVAIRRLQEDDMANAAADSPYAFSELEAAGNVVTWAHRFRTSDGGLFCAAGHEFVVEDGKILSWDFAFIQSCNNLVRVVESFMEAYNEGDLEQMMDTFGDEAVLRGHPLGSGQGSEAIRTVFEQDLASAAPSGVYELSNVDAIGGTVTWDQRWTDTSGGQRCATGYAAEVEVFRIVSWEWPETVPCG